MDWNKWRSVCSEAGLTSEETSESWTNYKNMILLSQDAAIAGFGSIEDYLKSDGVTFPNEYIDDAEKDLTNDGKDYNPFVEQVIGAFEELSEQIENEMEEQELTGNDLDEQLFIDMEDHSENLVESLAAIKDRIKFYKAKAEILQREADEAADDYAKKIRRSLDG